MFIRHIIYFILCTVFYLKCKKSAFKLFAKIICILLTFNIQCSGKFNLYQTFFCITGSCKKFSYTLFYFKCIRTSCYINLCNHAKYSANNSWTMGSVYSAQ